MQGFFHDDNGNRISYISQEGTISGVYDTQDRMLSYGNSTFGYTPTGSLKWKAEGTDTTRYNYDLMGNLISITLPNGDFIEYLIDAQNRRIGKKLNGVVEKQWIYQDQLNPVAELDGNGNLIARFVYSDKGHPEGSGQVVPAYIVKDSIVYRYVTDHLGSVRLVVNASTGAVVQRLEYDEFGNVLSNTAPDFQPFAYAGGLYDVQTELVRFGARDYDAEVGRWTSKDIIRFSNGVSNLYEYCHNDPIVYIDSWGTQQLVVYSDTGNSSGTGSKGSPSSGTSSGGWGHGFINVISSSGESFGIGFYPAANNTGKMYIDDVSSGHSYAESNTFNITEDQYNQILQNIANHMKNSPDWSLNNNCVDFVIQALDKAGIEHPSFKTLGISDPNKLAKWLKELSKPKKKPNPCL